MTARTLMLLILTVAYAAPGAAQAPAGEGEPAAQIGRAWTALSQGRTAEAVAAANEALEMKPRSHEAVAVKVAALAPSTPLAALDGYESWLARTTSEDVFLLDPIAQGMLWQMADEDDTGLRLLALESLSRGGSAGARARLRGLTGSTPAALAALAGLGDAPSATALVDGAVSGHIRSANAAELLPAAGPAAMDALIRLLNDPAPPVRADAVRGLGRIGARDAIPQLRAALTDPHPLVSSSAAAALTRLGDPEGEERANRMLGSEVPDMRLMAAAAFAARGDNRWTAIVSPLLQDPNGLTRLTAAELMAPIDPAAAHAVVAAALGDNNPVVRAEGARVLATPALSGLVRSDLASLRRLLRDPDPSVRLRAGALILELVAGRA